MGEVKWDQIINGFQFDLQIIEAEGPKSARLPCQCLISLLVFSENWLCTLLEVTAEGKPAFCGDSGTFDAVADSGDH